MKQKRFQYTYRSNASKLHKKTGDVLRAEGGIFAHFQIYQEYPVDKINTNFPDSRCKFDWVLPDILLVIECHGENHYQPINWGSQDDSKAIDQYKALKIRDQAKKDAALQAGYTYIVIPYTDFKILDEEYIWNLYQKEYNPIEPEAKKPKEVSKFEQDRLERAREYRKKEYKKKKEYLSKIKKGMKQNVQND